MERETKVTTDKEQTNFQESTAHIQPLVNPIPIPKPDVPKTLPKPNIPYPSGDIYDTKVLMKIFAPTIKNLLMNKDKLFELDKISLNENCSAMLLKKLPENLRDPASILRNGAWKRLIFHVDKHPQKHANESIKMINFIDVSCKDSFGEVLRLKKSNHFSSGSTTPLSDSRPSLISFETSDFLLEEFADELALLDPFPPRNEDDDFEADLREIELLLNQDPSTDFLPKITIDPNPERFIDEPALACLPPPGDDDDDKSFLKEDVQEENFQVYSNPLFEFDNNYNSSDINPLFNEILEDVKSKDSNVSNFDELVLLNKPLFDEDECFDPGGKIDKFDAFMGL
ncbi:hypothetical protein Tco_1294885 [Tanacetum coccineum]